MAKIIQRSENIEKGKPQFKQHADLIKEEIKFMQERQKYKKLYDDVVIPGSDESSEEETKPENVRKPPPTRS